MSNHLSRVLALSGQYLAGFTLFINLMNRHLMVLKNFAWAAIPCAIGLNTAFYSF